MQQSSSIAAWAVLALTVIFGSGCSTTPEPITVYETRTVYVDRYVPLDEALTRPVEVVTLPEEFLSLPEDGALISLGVAYKACRVRTMQCNGQLAEIQGVQDE